MGAMATVKNLKKLYAQTYALNGVNLELQPLEQYAIQGASGSGKSTLLYLLAGLDRASSGEIWIEGQNIQQWDDEQLAYYRNQKVGLVFQFHFLLPTMSCLDNIMLPAKIGGHDVSKVKKQAKELASLLGVSGCLQKYPYQISGGEQQRINVIRALSLRPKLLLCDEPTGNLDSANTQKVTNLLKQLALEFKATLVVVTHDTNVASQFNCRLLMCDGQLTPYRS